MQLRERHLSDEELVLAADGELGSRTRRGHAHLESCIQCRKKAAKFESVIAQVAHGQRDSLDSELPPIAGPRAMLRARLSAMSTSPDSALSQDWLFLHWLKAAISLAVVAMIAVLAALMAHRTPSAVVTGSAEGDIRPIRAFTPGIARQVSLDRVCSLSHEEVIKQVSPLQRQKVFEEYGIPLDQADKYEVDYLVTPGLGGDDDIRNLWPEPYNSAGWNAHVKDALEERLHELVCSRQLDLSEAQKAIATDWIAAYAKYVRASPSNTLEFRRTAPLLIATSIFARISPW